MLVSRTLLAIAGLVAVSGTGVTFARQASYSGATASLERLPYRTLTWADFRVNDVAPGLSAQTRTYLSQRYNARAVGSAGHFVAAVVTTEFDGGFDRSGSWRRSTVATNNLLLLVHEQGHLDISELKRRQLRRLRPENLPQGVGTTTREALDDLARQMKLFYKSQLTDLDTIQKRYDAETRNGTRREVQSEWTARLKTALLALPNAPTQKTADTLSVPTPIR